MCEFPLSHLNADRLTAVNIWDSWGFLDSANLYQSINPINLAGLASDMLDNLCLLSLCCKMSSMHYLLSQPVKTVLCNLFYQTYCEDLWTQRSLFHDAPQHQTKYICLKYTLHFPHLCFMVWRFLYPFVEDLVIEGPLAHCSLTPYFFLFPFHLFASCPSFTLEL